MARLLSVCLAISAVIQSSIGVSPKMDFGEEITSIVTNSSKADDEDVEVEHTIVVSTKLKNNNRRGIHNSRDEDRGILAYPMGRRNNARDDSDEVPVINGYRAVETTQIRTPDTRQKNVYPDSVFINRNIRDEYDIYPNLATNPMQWKPSNFYNNINSWNHNAGVHGRTFDRPVQSKLHRKITEDTVKEFYCRKCMELSIGEEGTRRCLQQRNTRTQETTTAKMKIDGKLAKLN